MAFQKLLGQSICMQGWFIIMRLWAGMCFWIWCRLDISVLMCGQYWGIYITMATVTVIMATVTLTMATLIVIMVIITVAMATVLFITGTWSIWLYSSFFTSSLVFNTFLTDSTFGLFWWIFRCNLRFINIFHFDFEWLGFQWTQQLKNKWKMLE